MMMCCQCQKKTDLFHICCPSDELICSSCIGNNYFPNDFECSSCAKTIKDRVKDLRAMKEGGFNQEPLKSRINYQNPRGFDGYGPIPPQYGYPSMWENQRYKSPQYNSFQEPYPYQYRGMHPQGMMQPQQYYHEMYTQGPMRNRLPMGPIPQMGPMVSMPSQDYGYPCPNEDSVHSQERASPQDRLKNQNQKMTDCEDQMETDNWKGFLKWRQEQKELGLWKKEMDGQCDFPECPYWQNAFNRVKEYLRRSSAYPAHQRVSTQCEKQAPDYKSCIKAESTKAKEGFYTTDSLPNETGTVEKGLSRSISTSTFLNRR